MELPKFKYIEDLKDVLTISDKFVKCDCCGKNTNIYTETLCSDYEINAICVDCIQSGLACEKFDGYFNEVPEINNDAAIEELSTRTPHLATFQELFWPDCCNDFCKYLRISTDKDMKNEKILSDLKETFKDEWFDVEKLPEMNPHYLLLFQCAKCGKHHVVVDLD